MKILVTGGCGYVGTKLVPVLLDAGHEVVVYDTQWFGNFLDAHSNLCVYQGDIRNIDEVPISGTSVIIHLANIANDPAVDLNPTLSWEVNVLATQQLLEKAIRSECVSQFIYASSGSVYGVKEEAAVTEDLELVPISAYNKTKMVAERVALSYASHMPVHCIRPATVCGYSPRMRLDVAVNMLTAQACFKNQITVFGGQQTRPNIHIDDMVGVYMHFLNNPELESGCYNAGFENISIQNIAEMVQELTGATISLEDSNDPRSYRQDSSKLLASGFERKHSVKQAIQELVALYETGVLVDDPLFHTVKTMKALRVS